MKYEIKGSTLPYVVCSLERDQKVICESGAMSWMSPNMSMETTSNGGVKKVFSRLVSGESLFQSIYTATNGEGLIAFTSSFPGSIMPIEINENNSIICQKSSFLAGSQNIELSIHFNKKIGVGLFGGEGFIMQKVTGNGIVFIEIDGSSETYMLGAGQQLVVSTGHLVMMDATCSIDVKTVPGLKNMFLGGEGIFNTIITGPGKVVLQSMPISKTANVIGGYLPLNNNGGATIGNSDSPISVNLGGLFKR